jgi:hypothetical protein
MTFDRFYPAVASAREVELAKIPIGDEEADTAQRADRRGGHEHGPLICAVSGPAGGIAAAAMLREQGLAESTFDRFYPAEASTEEPDLPKIQIGD